MSAAIAIDLEKLLTAEAVEKLARPLRAENFDLLSNQLPAAERELTAAEKDLERQHDRLLDHPDAVIDHSRRDRALGRVGAIKRKSQMLEAELAPLDARVTELTHAEQLAREVKWDKEAVSEYEILCRESLQAQVAAVEAGRAVSQKWNQIRDRRHLSDQNHRNVMNRIAQISKRVFNLPG